MVAEHEGERLFGCWSMISEKREARDAVRFAPARVVKYTVDYRRFVDASAEQFRKILICRGTENCY